MVISHKQVYYLYVTYAIFIIFYDALHERRDVCIISILHVLYVLISISGAHVSCTLHADQNVLVNVFFEIYYFVIHDYDLFIFEDLYWIFYLNYLFAVTEVQIW